MGIFSFFKPKSEAEAAPGRSEAATLDILLDDGVRAMKMGELKYAEKCFSKAVELQPAALNAVKYLAEARLRLQLFGEALPLLRQVAEAEPDNLDAHLLLAQTLGHTGDYAAMGAECNALLATHPEEVRACYLAGEAAHGLGDEFTAIAMLTKAVGLQEKFAAARLLRAKILAGMGQYNEVLEDARILVAADSENEDYLLLQGEALEAIGHAEEAERAYQSIYTLNPFSRDAVLHLAALYAVTARRDKALSLLDEAIELQPDFAEAYKLRGGIRLELKDTEGAADDLKKSLELSPELSAALDGEFSNIENRMNERMRGMNPFGF